MATKAKTTKEERNYKPAHATQPVKRKTDTSKIVKAVIFGPTTAILGVTLIYMSFWGITKAFTALHSIVTAHFVPWVGESWPIIVGAWAIVALTSGVYHFVVHYQKENKKENKAKQELPKENKQQKKTPTSTIFDAEPDTEFSEEELEGVGAYPYTPEIRDFSKEIDEIFGKTKNSNPDDLISLGKPSEPETKA